MSEKRLWDYIRTNIGTKGHFDRIESGLTVQGRPDVNYCINGVVGDIELKVYDKKKGGLCFRPAQITWMKKRMAAGGRVFAIGRFDKTFYVVRGEDVVLLDLLHNKTPEHWYLAADGVWHGSIDFDQLIKILTE